MLRCVIEEAITLVALGLFLAMLMFWGVALGLWSGAL